MFWISVSCVVWRRVGLRCTKYTESHSKRLIVIPSWYFKFLMVYLGSDTCHRTGVVWRCWTSWCYYEVAPAAGIQRNWTNCIGKPQQVDTTLSPGYGKTVVYGTCIREHTCTRCDNLIPGMALWKQNLLTCALAAAVAFEILSLWSYALRETMVPPPETVLKIVFRNTSQ